MPWTGQPKNANHTKNMNIKFDKQSWHARFYMKAYEQVPTANFCVYCRHLIIALVCLPLTWPTYIPAFDHFYDHTDRVLKGLAIIVCSAILWIIGFCIARDLFNQGGWWAIFWSLPCAAGFIAAVCALAVLLCVLHMAWVWMKDKADAVSDNVVMAYLKARKAKICPTIKWTDSHKKEDNQQV